MNRWQALDERLAQGEGELFYDLQILRLTPDGKTRFFVRAQWMLDNGIAFLMSAWIRPEDMHVESAGSHPSVVLRMRKFEDPLLPFSLKHLGMVLNVFDRDRDGWGEVLVGRRYYEGGAIELLEYAPSGPQKTRIRHSGGC